MTPTQPTATTTEALERLVRLTKFELGDNAKAALSTAPSGEASASPSQLVWVQNLIGFINGQFPADERWKSIFVKHLAALSDMAVVPREPTPEMLRAAASLKSPCVKYRDIYRAMLRAALSQRGTE